MTPRPDADSAPRTDSSSGSRDPVEQLAEEFLERKRRGEKPTIEEYAAKHPELAEAIRAAFPALVMIEDMGGSSLNATGSEGAAASAASVKRLERLGDYRILREVGRGGMGVVYEAEQESLGRRVALKVMSAGSLLDPKQVQRFEREAKAAAKLHHTNIVPVFGVGHEDGHHYYVMQFIAGLGLDAVLDELRVLRGGEAEAPAPASVRARAGVTAAEVARSLVSGRFAPPEPIGDDPADVSRTEPHEPDAKSAESEPDSDSSSVSLPGTSGLSALSETDRQFVRSVARVGEQVAEALAYAHTQGILHRDIKPSNLLLDLKGNVWVTDFGLAKAAADGDLTHTGDIVGTLRYMAPERFEGQADGRSDTYALGLTLYELLAVRPAFEAQDRGTLIKQVTEGTPPPLGKLNPSVPRDLETIVHKAIAREPAERYATAEAMAEDLRRFVDDEPIQARRISPAERAWRWCRRHPALAGMTAALLLSLVAGTIVSTVFAIRSNREATRARVAEADAMASEEQARTAETAAEAEARRARRLQYAADMQLAGQVWESDDGTAAKLGELLEEHIPADGEADLRDFAWRLLWTRLHHAEATGYLRGSISDAAFIPEGRLVTLSSFLGRDQIVHRWDPSDPDTIPEPINSFPPPGDTSFPFRLETIALAPDGTAIARFREEDGRLLVSDLDASTGRWERDLPAPAQSVRYSDDGRWLLVVGDDRVPRVYDAETGRRQAETEPMEDLHIGERGGLYDAEVAAGGSTVALANYPDNAQVTIVDLDAAESSEVIATGSTTVPNLAISADGRLAAWGDSEGLITLWDLERGETLGEPLVEPPTRIGDLDFSPDGRLLAAGWNDGQVSIWNVAERRRLARLKGHAARVATVRFSADSRRLVTCDVEGVIKVWDPKAPRGETVLVFDQSYPLDVAFSPDGETAAVARGVGLSVFGLQTDRPPQQVTDQWQDIRCYSVTFAPDGDTLAAGQLGGVHLLEFDAGRDVELSVPPQWQPSSWSVSTRRPVTGSVAFSPDGQWLAAGFGSPTWNEPDYDQIVAVWKVETGEFVHALTGFRNVVSSVAFTPDGSTLVAASRDGTVRFWDVGTWREARVLRSPSRSGFWSIAIAPDGETLAAGEADGPIVLWDLGTGRSRLLSGHGHRVSALAFAPTGRTLASASWDGTVKLWDVAAGRQTLTLRDHDNWVWDVAFSPTGDLLASTSYDGTVRLRRAKPLAAIDAARASVFPSYRAWQLAKWGRWEQAIAVYERMLREEHDNLADDPTFFHMLAGCRLQAGRLDGAAADYATALGLLPLEADSRALRDEIGDEVSAQPALFDRVLARRPDDPALHLARARSLARGDRPEEAVSAFERVIAAGGPYAEDPQLRVELAECLLELDRTDRAADVYADALERMATDASGSRRVELGSELRSRPEVFDRVLARRPNDPALRLARARSLAEQERWQEAVADFERAIEHDEDLSEDPEIRLELAECRVELGQFDRAAADYAAALEQMPQSFALHSERSRICDELTTEPEVFERLLELRPNDGLLHIAHAQSLARQRRWDKAAAAFERAEPYDHASEYHFVRCCVLLLAGDVEPYRALISEMAESVPLSSGGNDQYVIVRSAIMVPDAGVDLDELVRRGESLVEVQDFPWTRHSLAVAKLRAGQTREAISLLQGIVDEYRNGRPKGNLFNWPALALAHLDLGDVEEARRFLERAETMFETDPPAIHTEREPYTLDWLHALVLTQEARERLGDRPPDLPEDPKSEEPAIEEPAPRVSDPPATDDSENE